MTRTMCLKADRVPDQPRSEVDRPATCLPLLPTSLILRDARLLSLLLYCPRSEVGPHVRPTRHPRSAVDIDNTPHLIYILPPAFRG